MSGWGRTSSRPDPTYSVTRADRALGFSLRAMCLDGPEEELTRTEHAQPALFALSFALWDLFATETGIAPCGSGRALPRRVHRPGRRRLLRLRLRAGDSDPPGPGDGGGRRGVTIGDGRVVGNGRGRDEPDLRSTDRHGGTARGRQYQRPGPDRGRRRGRPTSTGWWRTPGSSGVRRVIPLKVSGAFHSTFMEPAAVALADRARARSRSTSPAFPVWANTTARPHTRQER